MTDTDRDRMVREIREELESFVDVERKEWSENYYPTSMEVIGVKVPDQRKVVRSLKKRLKGTSDREKLQLAKDLAATNIFECQQVGYELIGKSRKLVASLGPEDILELSKGLDNWISVDTFSATIMGPAWRDGQIPHETVLDWARSEDRWKRRAAVVCTIALNQKARGGTGDPERTIEICELVSSDTDDMVAKALSWALRELSKREKGPVEDFLQRHEDRLAPRVLREVRRKLDTGRKNG